MKNLTVLILTILLLFTGCVTTDPGTVEKTGAAAVEQETPVNSETPSEETDETSGIIYSTQALAEGPLLLGSKEHMTGPIMEFSLLYSIYFPLSGIVPSLSHYEIGKGTRWQVESEKLQETVYFERALLSSDDENNSWWYLKVEGDGFIREYEFLVDREWQLLELRYRKGNDILSYFPTVEGESDLSAGPVDFNTMESTGELLETAFGELQTDHFTSSSREYWKSGKVTGQFVRSAYFREEELILEATILAEDDGYETVLGSY